MRFRLALALVLVLAPVAALAAETAGSAGDGPAATAAAPAAPAQAQPAAGNAPTEPVPQGFEPVSGAAQTQAPIAAPPLVVAAYLFIWAMTFLYVVVLWRRQRRMKDELDLLQQRLERAVGAADPSSAAPQSLSR